ncbi:MAG: YceI family protein [Bacteroidetes bacterium]|nr:MAG: YceI family protein [Bacteroidota bacterium]
MKKNLVFALMLLAGTTFAQKKVTTSGSISFDATTPIDALPKADNKTVIASLDTKTGAVAFEAIMKNFAFTNPKIQQHFNAPNWLDSEKYPKATFTGSIVNLKGVNFKKDGTYNVDVEGDLTMHGETKKITTPAKFVVAGATITGTTDFTVKLDDFKIDGPAVGAGKVAKDPKITVLVEFK